MKARRSATPACWTAAASTSSGRRCRWDGPTLTIRKFKKDKLKLDDLVKFGSISIDAARVLKVIGNCRCNILISGGTGSARPHCSTA